MNYNGWSHRLYIIIKQQIGLEFALISKLLHLAQIKLLLQCDIFSVTCMQK